MAKSGSTYSVSYFQTYVLHKKWNKFTEGSESEKVLQKNCLFDLELFITFNLIRY
jgi:hypothetical protein